MNRAESLELARAVKACKENDLCIFPRCKDVVAQCWTEEEIQEELARPVALVSSEFIYRCVQEGRDIG